MKQKSLQVRTPKFDAEKIVNSIKVIDKPRSKPKKISENDIISSVICQSNVFYRRHKVDALKNNFPLYPSLWYVDKYYPVTPFGEVYIDEAKNDLFLKKSLAKKEFLKDKIFLIIEANDDEYTLQKKLDDEIKRLMNANNTN